MITLRMTVGDHRVAFSVSIASWNSQGNPLDESLSVGFLQQLLTDHDVVVLQSCCDLVGTAVALVSSVTIGRIRCNIRGFRQPISVDPQSSVAILSRYGSDFPLVGGTALEVGVAGRFGIVCTVDHPAAPFEVIGIQSRGGVSPELTKQMLRDWRDRLDPTCPHIVAVELDGSEAMTGAANSVDNRSVRHPSPGARHDSFIASRVAGLTDGGIIDANGASDYDAVRVVAILSDGSDEGENKCAISI